MSKPVTTDFRTPKARRAELPAEPKVDQPAGTPKRNLRELRARANASRNEDAAGLAPRFDTPEWLVAQFRLTIFSKDIDSIEVGDWRALTSEAPQTTSTTPHLGQTTEIGNLPTGDGVQLVLLRQLSRADLILGPVIVPVPLPAIFHVGTIDNVKEIVPPLISKWLPRPVGISRVAVGCSMLLPARNPDEANARLLSHLPYISIHGSYSELAFQINRPTRSAIQPALMLNRFTKWSTAAVMTAQLDQQLHIPVPFPAQRSFATSCLTDFSTDAETSLLPQKKVVPLIEELMTATFETAMRGDCP